MRWSKIDAMIRKELKQLRRDRLTAAMVFGIPVMQLLLFGYAINYNVRHIPAAWCDQSETQISRLILEDIRQSQVLDLTVQAASPRELGDLIRSGRVRVGILLPPDLTSRLQDSRPAFQILADGSSSIVTGAVKSLAAYPLYTPAGGIETEHAINAEAHEKQSIQIIPLYNPEQRTAVDVIPGLVGIILTMTLTLFTAIALVREREHGSMEMLITTPISAGEIILGKLIPYVGIGLFQTFLVFILGILVFRLPINGRFIDIAGAVIMFITATLSMGLLISSFARTQFQAVQVTIFILLPSILLSGFVFPYEGMPRIARILSQLLPATHFIELMRGIVLRGATLTELPRQVIALGVFILITTTAAWERMKGKRLD